MERTSAVHSFGFSRSLVRLLSLAGVGFLLVVVSVDVSVNAEEPNVTSDSQQSVANEAQHQPFDKREIRSIVEEVLREQRSNKGVTQAGYEYSANQSWVDSVSDRLSVKLDNDGQLTIYGYGRGDLIFADSRLSNTIIPFFALSEDPASSSPVRDDDSQFNVNVRLTRLGLDYGGTRAEWFGQPDLNAKLEIDFETLLGSTSESRAVPRIRLAYGKMTWGEFSVLIGQDWDIISPLNPMINDDTLMWQAGNLGDRRPMFRTTWDHEMCCGHRLIVDSALSSGGAIDGQDLDSNGIKDGEDSGLPSLQQRFGYQFPSYVLEQSAAVGLYWFLGFENVVTPVGGENNFVSRGVGIDWSLPILSRVTWRGELWYGRDLSDWRGGIGQGVNTTTGDEIESRGGWTELQLQMAEWYKFAAGFTADDPVDSNLIGNATQRKLNWTWYLGNRFNLGGGLNIHVNLEFWNTEYLALDKGDAMRFKTVLIQKF